MPRESLVIKGKLVEFQKTHIYTVPAIGGGDSATGFLLRPRVCWSWAHLGGFLSSMIYMVKQMRPRSAPNWRWKASIVTLATHQLVPKGFIYIYIIYHLSIPKLKQTHNALVSMGGHSKVGYSYYVYTAIYPYIMLTCLIDPSYTVFGKFHHPGDALHTPKSHQHHCHMRTPTKGASPLRSWETSVKLQPVTVATARLFCHF